MASLYDLKSGKFHSVIYQSVTIHFHPSMVYAVSLKALYFLTVQTIGVFMGRLEPVLAKFKTQPNQI